jgi:4-diphosphocytidyl-2-C-methyl-D-erythritol kinase
MTPTGIEHFPEHQTDDFLVLWAPAKVNLYLEVLGKRPDGYHEIATAMVAVNLYDTLRLREDDSGQVSLHCSDPSLAVDQSNLVMRAATLLQQRTGCRRGVQIHLTKRIPMAAGLAGGSSDAAATLAGLNQMWQLGLARDELARLAAELGSDVAFFYYPPAAWCTGRGEVVTPLPLGRPLWLVVVKPPVGLTTADVYRALPRQTSEILETSEVVPGEAIRQALATGDLVAAGRLLHNRLQPAAEALCPVLADYRERLARLQPAGVALSGSGTSLFALCADPGEALRFAWQVRLDPDNLPGTRVYVVRSGR